MAHEPEGTCEPRPWPRQALLGRQIIAGKVETGIKQVIDVFDGKIVFRKPITKEKKVEAAGA